MCISSVEQGKRNMESDARRWLYKYFRIDFLSNKLKGFSLSYRTANYIIFSQISTPCLQLAKHCSLYVEALNNAYLLSIHGNPTSNNAISQVWSFKILYTILLFTSSLR